MKLTKLVILAILLIALLVACENLLGGSDNAPGSTSELSSVTGRVQVAVDSEQTPEGVPNATVEAWTGNTLLLSGLTDSDGNFVLEGTIPTNAHIVVSIEGHEIPDPDELGPLYAGAARPVSELVSDGLIFSFTGPFADGMVDNQGISVAWNVSENGDDTPLSIANIYQLQVIPESDGDPDVVLVRDIDASVTGEWNSNGGFTPISRFEDRTFEGQGFTISDLVIEARPEARAGLFEQITNATVRNVVFSDVLIDSAEGTAGALAARTGRAIIQNVSVSGNLSSLSDSSLGGLVGEAADDSVITNTSFSGSVTSTGSTGSDSGIGGLIGVIDGGTVVEDSTSNATITASTRDRVGGLIGWQRSSRGVDDTYAAILRSTSSGSVDGAAQVGGLIGRSEDLTVVANSSSTSDVTASTRGGALVGVRVYSDINNILGEGNSASGALTVDGEAVSSEDESYLIGDLEDD